jgi:hypothetical protein
MPAPVIAFESAVVARAPGHIVVIALMDGSPDASARTCVAIVTCREETARGLTRTLGSVLEDE